MRFVSNAGYNLNGIANSKVRPDSQRALQMFQFAATTFGDANAQYDLARMHLDGAGVDKDGREAIRWLFLAADKAEIVCGFCTLNWHVSNREFARYSA